MKVSCNINEVTPVSQIVSVVLEADDALSLKAEFDQKLVERSHVEGFRKGKAPIGVVVAKVGRDKYWKDLREYIASEALTEALKKEDIEPVVAPKYEFADWEEGGKFVFTATIYTKPPGYYRGAFMGGGSMFLGTVSPGSGSMYDCCGKGYNRLSGMQSMMDPVWNSQLGGTAPLGWWMHRGGFNPNLCDVDLTQAQPNEGCPAITAAGPDLLCTYLEVCEGLTCPPWRGGWCPKGMAKYDSGYPNEFIWDDSNLVNFNRDNWNNPFWHSLWTDIGAERFNEFVNDILPRIEKVYTDFLPETYWDEIYGLYCVRTPWQNNLCNTWASEFMGWRVSLPSGWRWEHRQTPWGGHHWAVLIEESSGREFRIDPQRAGGSFLFHVNTSEMWFPMWYSEWVASLPEVCTPYSADDAFGTHVGGPYDQGPFLY